MKSVAYGKRLVLVTGFDEAKKASRLWVFDDQLRFVCHKEHPMEHFVIHSCISNLEDFRFILLLDSSYKVHLLSIFRNTINCLNTDWNWQPIVAEIRRPMLNFHRPLANMDWVRFWPNIVDPIAMGQNVVNPIAMGLNDGDLPEHMAADLLASEVGEGSKTPSDLSEDYSYADMEIE